MKLQRFAGCMAAAVLLASTSASMALTVAQAKALPTGSVVTLDGVIITETLDLMYNNTLRKIFVQDNTGGFAVFGSNADVDAVLAGRQAGDRISITATTSLYTDGMWELTAPFTATYIDSPGVPAPIELTLADLQEGSAAAELYESMLIKLSSVKFTTTGNFVGGASGLYLSADGLRHSGADVQVYVTGDTPTPNPLEGHAIPQGFVNFTAVLAQYDTSEPRNAYYELLPFALSNIEELSPSATSATSVTVKNAPKYTITLQGTPIGAGTLTYKISQTVDKMFPSIDHGVQGGTLYLPGTSTPVTVGAALPGNTVDFQPAAGVSGWYQFTFAVSQASYSDASATVDVFIQDPGRVVITEILVDAVGPSYEYDWEYVEIKNVSGFEVTLDTLFDDRLRDSANVEHNLANADDYGAPAINASIIPAGQTRVIAESNEHRSVAEFLNAWNPGAGDATYPDTGGNPAKIQRSNFIVLNYAASLVALPGLDNTGDTLVLLDAAGNCLDAVKYEVGTNGWPGKNDCGSIFLESDKINVTDNDNGANWRLSATGVADSIAYASAEAFGPPREQQVGSPGLIPTHPTTPVTSTPLAVADAVLDTVLNQGATSYTSIDLDPTGAYAHYKIVGLAQGYTPTTGTGGSFKDGGSLADITAGMTLTGHTVMFKPDGVMTGRYAFTWVANDGTADGPINYVSIFVQDHNRVVVTEIMYNPWNLSSTEEWEWIELKNLTSSPIALHSFLDAGYQDYTEVFDTSKPGNLIGITIPANGTKVIAREPSTGSALWLAQWFQPSAAASTSFLSSDRWPALNNSTATGKTYADRVVILGADGSLLDAVTYDDGAPWPVDSTDPAVYRGHSSIYLTGSTLDTFVNDSGANWAFAVSGTDDAYTTTNGLDFGSPGILVTDVSAIFDFNGDGAVDVLNDQPVFITCANGPGIPHDGSTNCQKADYNQDGDVDMADFGMFQMCLQASGATPPAACLR